MKRFAIAVRGPRRECLASEALGEVRVTTGVSGADIRQPLDRLHGALRLAERGQQVMLPGIPADLGAGPAGSRDGG